MIENPQFHQEFRAELEARQPAERVVITGYAAQTAFGDEEATFQGILEGRSTTQVFPEPLNEHVNIAAPITDFDPSKDIIGSGEIKKMRRVHPFAVLSVVLARRAGEHAGLLDDNGRLYSDINRRTVGSFVASGAGGMDSFADVYETLHHRKVRVKDESGQEKEIEITDVVNNSGRVDPSSLFKVELEQGNGHVAIVLGLSGDGLTIVGACATSLLSVNAGYDSIKQGLSKIAFVGGVDFTLKLHPEVAIGMFNQIRAISRRNSDPEHASRPFDTDRDGFVMADGGGVLVLESLESALERGVSIYGEVLGSAKSMDGYRETELDSQRVGQTILETLYDKKRQLFRLPGAIFAHATSTPLGDRKEAEAFRFALGEYLQDIPITAIKSNLGHLLGGAGAVNAIVAIQSLNKGVIPAIAHLENPDPEFLDLRLVRENLYAQFDTALTVAYGFGGYNSAVLVGKRR